MTIKDSAEAYASSKGFSLNEAGQLFFDYGAAYNNLGKWSDPYFTSNYALALYRDWLETKCKDDSLKAKFLNQAQILHKSAEMRNGMAVWAYPFENKYYNLPKGWLSGIGQARIASVMLRAHAITKDAKYITVAQKAMIPYERTTSRGGVVVHEKDITWIEEAVDSKKVFKVLNGHITAIAGIRDIYSITGDERWHTLVKRATAAVAKDIHLFDLGYTSLYSLEAPWSERPAAGRGDYNTLHVAQLLWLFEIDPNPIFLEYASRFQAYEQNSDVLTASHSIDPLNHGPMEAKAQYQRYWSTGQLPAWLNIQFGNTESIKGLSIDGNTALETPKNIEVFTRKNGEFVRLKKISLPQQLRHFDINFDKPISTKEIRVTFSHDKPIDLIVLRAVMPIRQHTVYAPISNDCNYRPSHSNKIRTYNTDAAFGGSNKMGMKIHCPGWLIVPTESRTFVSINAIGKKNAQIIVDQSDSFSRWESPQTIPVMSVFKLRAEKKFLRIRFKNDLQQIKITPI